MGGVYDFTASVLAPAGKLRRSLDTRLVGYEVQTVIGGENGNPYYTYNRASEAQTVSPVE